MNWAEKKLYYILNNASNSFSPNKVNNKLDIKKFKPSNIEKRWNNLGMTDTASRKLCDLFWMNLPWQLIETELGLIKIIDTGCGNGDYARKITNWSSNRINRYIGIDLIDNSHWRRLMDSNKKFNFQICDYLSVKNCLKKDTNLFITQSSIEHFKYDLKYFNYINEFVKDNKKSTIQIHIFPSAPCLKLYGFHGYRQYTRRKASIIFEVFKKRSLGVLFELGGNYCNELHYKYITKQLNEGIKEKRHHQKSDYDAQLKKAIIKDCANNNDNNPSFYALCIHSYPNNSTIFSDV
jgi:SAM-dependent methyltransferase